MKEIFRWGGIIVGLWIVAAVIWRGVGGGGNPPDTAFLGAELYVTPGARIAPGPGGFSIYQIVDTLGTGRKT